MEHTYLVNLVDRKGKEFTIFDPTTSLNKAREVALRQDFRRVVKSYRDGKLQLHGRYALDDAAYTLWWKDKENV